MPFQKIDLVRRSVSENGVKRVKMVLSYFFIWGIYSTSDSIAFFFLWIPYKNVFHKYSNRLDVALTISEI